MVFRVWRHPGLHSAYIRDTIPRPIAGREQTNGFRDIRHPGDNKTRAARSYVRANGLIKKQVRIC